jgi:hypothetical protein
MENPRRAVAVKKVPENPAKKCCQKSAGRECPRAPSGIQMEPTIIPKSKKSVKMVVWKPTPEKTLKK